MNMQIHLQFAFWCKRLRGMIWRQAEGERLIETREHVEISVELEQ